MGTSNSLGATMSRGVRLAAAIAQNADRLTLPEPQKQEFDEALAQFQSILVRRDNLKAEKQELSRQLDEAGLRLRNATVNTKALVKGLIGSTAERLTEFQIKPRRQVTVSDRAAQKAAARERAKKNAAEAALAAATEPAVTAETQG